MSEIEKDIEKLKKEAADKKAEASKLEALLFSYPDLRRRTGRWNKVAYYSQTVNGRVTGVDIRFNCGCCSDSPLEAWPYVETEHGKIYSDPPDFWVGNRNYDLVSGVSPVNGWDKIMRDKGISEIVIEKVRAYMGEPEEKSYDDEEQ